jgi:hypothetical protein
MYKNSFSNPFWRPARPRNFFAVSPFVSPQDQEILQQWDHLGPSIPSVLLQLDEAELDAFDPFLVVWIYGTLW